MISLRPSTPADAATLAEVHIDAWRTAYRGLVPDSFLAALDREQRTERFREFLESGSADIYIIERDDQVIGHLRIGPCRDNDLDERSVGEIWGIYLAPMHWRQGIGTKVCRQAEEILSLRGFRQIVLWVFKENESARRFYEAVGYAPDGARRVIEVGASLPAVRYRKDLTDAAASPETIDDREVHWT